MSRGMSYVAVGEVCVERVVGVVGAEAVDVARRVRPAHSARGFVQGAKDVESLLWHAVLADKLRELCRTSSSEHDKLFGTRVEPP